MRMPATSVRILLYCTSLTMLSSVAGFGQDSSEARSLVRQLGQFPAAIDPRIQGNSGRPTSTEQKREALYVKLRALDRAAVRALQHGLMDTDVQIRRNMALYLGEEGGNYAKHAPAPLDLRPFLPQLVHALRDEDQRVKELAAQALGHIGSEAAIAVPDLIRLLEDPAEGLRNSACIGLAGIGPAAREALPALRGALADPSNDVRRFAQRAIDRIETKVRQSELAGAQRPLAADDGRWNHEPSRLKRHVGRTETETGADLVPSRRHRIRETKTLDAEIARSRQTPNAPRLPRQRGRE